MVSVLLFLPQEGLRRWHRNLVEALGREGVDARVALRPGAASPPAVALLDRLEGMLFARNGASGLEAEPLGAWLHLSSDPADLAFDLTGRAEPESGAIFPVFAGMTGDDARDLMLLSGEEARLGLARIESGRQILCADAVIALESPHSFRRGRDAVALRLSTLIRAVARRGKAEGLAADGEKAPPPGLTSAAAFLLASLTARARSKLTRLVAHEGHWRVAWRRIGPGDDSVLTRLEWPNGGWSFLEDDRHRYFADPFLFEHQGALHLFCEEYPYATGKGVISHVQLDAQGRALGPPRVVLERPCHLSYPLVFESGGQIWMMPESSAAGTLELYRADPFPGRWTLDRVLIENLALADATFFEQDGRFWLTATSCEDGGSSWDCLSLFTGASALGPWTRCGAGPVLIDASSARPAGRLFHKDGALWRPAQDCTGGYGSGLALCRVEGVSEEGVRQSVVRRLGPPPGVSAEGVHTLNAAAGFETIDVVGTRLKRG